MTTVLNIFLNVNGEAIAEDYKFKYKPNMSNQKLGDKQLYMVYGVKFDKEDLIEFGNYKNLFDTNNPKDEELIKIFVDYGLVQELYNFIKVNIRPKKSKKYGETNKKKIIDTLLEAKNEGFVENNIEVFTDLILRNKKNIKLEGQLYTIADSKNVENKIIEKTLSQIELIKTHMDITVYRGEIEKQKIKCIARRQKIRNLVKEIFNDYDLLGEPKKSKTIPVMLIKKTAPNKPLLTKEQEAYLKMNKELYNEQLKNPNKQLFPEFYRNRQTDSDLRYERRRRRPYYGYGGIKANKKNNKSKSIKHKRRTSISQLYKQLHFFGRARINVNRFWPGEIKLVHLLPLFFVLGLVFWLSTYWLYLPLFKLGGVFIGIYFLSIFWHSTLKHHSLDVGFLSVITSFMQLFGYGLGMIAEVIKPRGNQFFAQK